MYDLGTNMFLGQCAGSIYEGNACDTVAIDMLNDKFI